MAQARFGTGLIAGVLAGLLAGWMLGRLSQTSLAPQARVATEPTSSVDVAALAGTAEREQTPAREASDRNAPLAGEETPPEASLLSESLRDRARAGIGRGWSKVRDDPIPEPTVDEGLATYERAVRELPDPIGRSLAEDASEAERDAETPEDDAPAVVGSSMLDALRARDAIAVLDLLDAPQRMEPRLDLVNDEPTFARLFPGSAGKALDGPAHLVDSDGAIEDGSVMDFPSGVFRPRLLMRKKDPFPRDVTLRGAGMDATLLLVSRLSTRGELRDFALVDCTVFTENPLFDLRDRPASLLLERVRVIGFDNGAGGSSLLDARGLVLLARACRFEGGYGRSPSYANLFDVRSNALLARFEGCWIDQVNQPSLFLHPGASVVFADCVLTNLLERTGYLEHAGVAYPGSTVTFFSGDPRQAPRKDMDKLFPDWQRRIQE